MSFVRSKLIKGHLYFYLVESVREGEKVRQKIIKYFGTTRPDPKYYLLPPKVTTTRPVSTTAPAIIPVENVDTPVSNEWDEAKRRLRGKHFAYMLKPRGKPDPWATGPAKRPDRGDRVQIIKKMGYSCLVEFQGSRCDIMCIHLSPEPPIDNVVLTQATPPVGTTPPEGRPGEGRSQEPNRGTA